MSDDARDLIQDFLETGQAHGAIQRATDKFATDMAALRDENPEAFRNAVAALRTEEGQAALEHIAHLVVNEPDKAEELRVVLADLSSRYQGKART